MKNLFIIELKRLVSPLLHLTSVICYFKVLVTQFHVKVELKTDTLKKWDSMQPLTWS